MATEECGFNREEERKHESPSVVTETKSTFGSKKSTSKVVTKIKEYFHDFSCTWEIMAFKGTCAYYDDDCV